MRRVAAEHEYVYGRTHKHTHTRTQGKQHPSLGPRAALRATDASASRSPGRDGRRLRTLGPCLRPSAQEKHKERERDVLSPTVAPLNSVFRADIHLGDIFPEQNVGRRAAQHPGSEPVAPVGRAPHAGRDCCPRPKQRVPGRRRHVEQFPINCRPA